MSFDLKYVKQAAVFGSGAFGTSLSCVLSKKSEKVKVWHIKPDEVVRINEERENMYFLKGTKLPSNVIFTSEPAECLKGVEIVLLATPTQYLRNFLEKNVELFRTYVFDRQIPVVLCSKGIERSTLMFPVRIVTSMFPGCRLAVLAGPSFAAEVASGNVTHVAIAHNNISSAREVQRIMTTPDGSFHCWATTDTIGCEVASAVKNVLAIFSGVVKGLGMGLNARAALIARGLLEIRDLTLALGGTGEAVFGLAGLGDLLLTCSSELSRNFMAGLRIGKGETMEMIQRNSKAVAEGVATADPLERLAKKYNISLPICHEVYLMLYKNKRPEKNIFETFSGGLRDEGLPPLFNGSKL